MIQKATKKDIRTLAELAILLWEDSFIDELINDFSEILSKEDAQIFLKYEMIHLLVSHSVNCGMIMWRELKQHLLDT